MRVLLIIRIKRLALYGCAIMLSACTHSPHHQRAEVDTSFNYQTRGVSTEQDAIIEAVKAGNAELVHSLALKGNLGLNNAYETTPLHVAVCLSNLEVVAVLLRAGGDPSITDWTGYNVLSIAVFKGNNDAVEMILAAGFSPDMPNAENAVPTAMMLAVAGPPGAGGLYRITGKRTSDYQQRNASYLRNVIALARAGANLSYSHPRFGSYIDWAISSGNDEAVTLLLSLGGGL